MTLTFKFQRYTKNYSVYVEKDGLNKLYLPLEVNNPEIYVSLSPRSQS